MLMRVFKWILIDIFFFPRLFRAGILDTKTSSSMETLIDSASSKTVNYAYASSVIAADDEFINATAAAAAPLHRRHHQKQQEQKNQRPMLPPPISVTSEDSPDSPANDVSLYTIRTITSFWESVTIMTCVSFKIGNITY